MQPHKPAGFWIRVLAVIVDGILSSVLTWIIAIIMNDDSTAKLNQSFSQTPESLELSFEQIISPSDTIAGLLYVIIFIIIFTATSLKGSPGKLICRIQVVNPDMSQISIGKSIGRYFAYLLSAVILFIGLMMAGWTREKRALHDMICNTRVVYRDK